jgi:hypothetical protein
MREAPPIRELEASVPAKLGLKAGMRVLLLNAPAGYRAALAAVAPGLSLEEAGGSTAGELDAVHVFCPDRVALDRHGPAALAAFRPGHLLWVSYPKGGSGVPTDLGRDVDWGPFTAADFRPIRQVAIDPVWSALRFRPRSEVGQR